MLSSVLWGVGIFLLTFTLSLAFVGTLIVFLPRRYFVDQRRLLADRPPLVRWLAILGKNLLGLVLVALGIGLSLPGIPGQGIATILIGLILIDFPGQRRLVRMLARQPWVQRSMNGLRSRCGRPPLEFEK